MITLYGALGSVYVRKVKITLQEKQLPFQAEAICPMHPLPDDYHQISPLGKIPALTDDDFAVADSSVICAYLEKQYPATHLYPKEAKAYAQALWFEEYADTVLFAAVAPCYYQTILIPLHRQLPPNIKLIEQALKHKLPAVAGYLESYLAEIPEDHYLVDNAFSIADISVGSVFFNMYQSGYPLDAQRWPLLSDYLIRLFSRPSFKDCVEDIDAEKRAIEEQVLAIS